MPEVYAVYCETCDKDSEKKPDSKGYEACSLFGDYKGKIFSPWYRGVLRESGELVPLSHPSEHQILKGQGYSWLEASIKGKLVSVDQRICSDCGSLNDRVRIDFLWTEGCLLISLLLGIGTYFIFQTSWFIGFWVFLGAAVVQSFGLPFLFHLLYGHRIRHLENKVCKSCGGTSVLSVEKASKSRLTCPKCKNKNLIVRVAGRS